MIQEEYHDLTKKFLEEKGLEDNYGMAIVQGIMHSDGTEINRQNAFTWGGEKGLHGRIGLEVSEGLFSLAIQIIEDISKTPDIAKVTIMKSFGSALAEARGMAEEPEKREEKSE